jgi:branched-chain amino acid transport system substrate-binding protein
MPDVKIAVLWQNDDLGPDYLSGFKQGLADKADSMIVWEASFSVADPTIESQIVTLKESGADLFFIVAPPKAAAQAIRGAHELDWHPARFLVNVASSVGAVLKPADLEASNGIISAAYQKDPNDPQRKDDPGVKDWNVWINRYLPGADKTDFFNVYGYNSAQTPVEILKRCGDLTCENVMKQATSLNTTLPMLLPSVKRDLTASDGGCLAMWST